MRQNLNMQNKLISRIANGLGNQLFMYASSYSISKKLGKELEIDDESGFLKERRNLKYELNNFNISSKITNNKYKFNTFKKNLIRKIYKKIDHFKVKKKFIIEDKNKKGFINYSEKYIKKEYENIAFIEGYFQSEKYFKEYEYDLRKELSFNEKITNKHSDIKNKILESNSVQIHIRNHVFTETKQKRENHHNIKKSEIYTKKTIEHCKNAINFIKLNTSSPKFFIFSNDFTFIKKIFTGEDFIYVDNNENLEPIEDFYLMSLCKNFVISPSTFSWWAAWLSNNKNKICIKPPKELPMSSNLDIFPNDWISI